MLDYDNGDGTYTSTGQNTFSDSVILEAGGENIFHDIKDAYPTVSPEEIISRNPEAVIVSSYYTEEDGQNKIASMKESGDFSEVEAVAEERFLSLGGLSFGAEAGMQSIDALEEIARFLHPEAF